MAKNEQRFYSALKDMFIGEQLEGQSGYVNLMKIKSQYFSNIEPFIKNEIDEKVSNSELREELYNKLFTFFESYFNETGTPFFYKTQIHKNIYEKVYSDRDDVALFWKTQKLYYVKSEANYSSIENMSVTDAKGFSRTFNFDASELEHQKNNEKKTLVFHLTKISEDKMTYSFKVRYAKNSDYDRVKKYFNQNSNDNVKKYILENYDSINNSQVIKNKNFLDTACLTKDDIYIRNIEDTIESVRIELSINKLDSIEKYFNKKTVICPIDLVKQAFAVYKKQNEIDYFIHKDAEGFLKEQFDIYVYHYIFGEQNLSSDLTSDRVNEIKLIKEIAYKVIEYIAKFENELKAIWEKPKFVRKSNYVLTLDRLENNIALVEKIINHPNFNEQIEEWKNLHKQWLDENGKELKKVWKEFETASKTEVKEIVQKGKLNEKYKYLPIDTKFFEDIKYEILSNFDNLKEALNGELVKSDNWQALNTLALKYNEKIQTIYIDPPFNTGSDFAYKDGYQDSTWLTLMDNRISLAKNYLNQKGSFFLHLDGNANYLGKILMKNNFNENNFINELIWAYRSGGASKKTSLPKKHDNIYLYSKDNNHFEISPIYERQYYEKNFMGASVDENGRFYADTMIRDILEGVMLKVVDGQVQYAYNVRPVLNTTLERWGFDTQKPEGLINILFDFVNSNDYIMDFFSGSGTTVSSAHKKNIKWLGVEQGEHFYNVILPRLKKVLIGDEQGISNITGWHGGGFFKYYELEQYEEALARCRYQNKEINLSEIKTYSFNPDNEKMLSALQLDIENEKAFINLEKLYPDIDLAETLSNITGKFIKKLSKDTVVFEDDTKIDLTDMSFDNMKLLKPLLWWKN